MFYAIAGKAWSGAVVTNDGMVVQTTGNFEWACGLHIRDILMWANQHDMRWSVSAIVPPGLIFSDAMIITRRRSGSASAGLERAASKRVEKPRAL